MDKQTIEKLLTLNRQFYATFARPFAASRSLSDPALTCILPYIPQCARVLDVGCGNGRLALLLNQERPGTTYRGIDTAPELVEVARAQARELESISVKFYVADVVRPGWDKEIDDLLFDRVVILAVLHHIPSLSLRSQVLRESASLLASDGRLILSTWQFLDSARMRRKIVNWTKASIPKKALEPGDYLLDWKREGVGLRYCHLVDETEVEHLAVESGLRVHETFRAGGREGNLSLFVVLEKSPSQRPQLP